MVMDRERKEMTNSFIHPVLPQRLTEYQLSTKPAVCAWIQDEEEGPGA